MAYSVSVAGFQSSCIFVSYVSIGPFDCVCVVCRHPTVTSHELFFHSSFYSISTFVPATVP